MCALGCKAPPIRKCSHQNSIAASSNLVVAALTCPSPVQRPPMPDPRRACLFRPAMCGELTAATSSREAAAEPLDCAHTAVAEATGAAEADFALGSGVLLPAPVPADGPFAVGRGALPLSVALLLPPPLGPLPLAPAGPPEPARGTTSTAGRDSLAPLPPLGPVPGPLEPSAGPPPPPLRPGPSPSVPRPRPPRPRPLRGGRGPRSARRPPPEPPSGPSCCCCGPLTGGGEGCPSA